MSISVSIVIPAYNAHLYIADSLRSILGQMRPAHELIVIDDGSTDGTRERIQETLAAWPALNARLVTQANQGVSAARNHGLSLARGEYISFVDCDDIVLPGTLDALEEAIAAHQPDVMVWDFNMWHPHKDSKSRISMGYPPGQVIRDNSVMLRTFFADRHMYVWAHVFRRAIYNGLPVPVFPPGRVYEDVATLPRLLKLCSSLVYLPRPIIDYRQHPTSITRVISERWCLDFTSALALARANLDQTGIDDTVKLHFDIAASTFYIGVVKNSFQLSLEAGRRVRAEVKEIFKASLYNSCDEILAAIESGQTQTRDRKGDRKMMRQVKQALAGNLFFELRQLASRRLKRWQRERRAGGAAA